MLLLKGIWELSFVVALTDGINATAVNTDPFLTSGWCYKHFLIVFMNKADSLADDEELFLNWLKNQTSSEFISQDLPVIQGSALFKALEGDSK